MQAEEEEEESSRIGRAMRDLAARLAELSALGPITISQKDIWRMKLEVCAIHGLKSVPKNSEILAFLGPEERKELESRLRRKNIRTRSGVAIVTAITRPFDCPHGTCTFCPGGPRFGTPQSYTRDSPASSFGSARNFEAARQVSDSLKILKGNGHDTSKIELILLGGTILAMPLDYQKEFVQQSYEALNEEKSESLEEAKVRNERAPHRCVGLTIETKPDWCGSSHVDLLLSYGVTRVEIGVQSLREEVLRATNRGHTLCDTIESFQVSRDSGLKIVAHMMPGLPLSTLEKDLDDLLSLVNDEKLRPDMLKIYPTLVVEGTALHRQYLLGKYKSYALDDLIDLLCKFKRSVPPWLRIMRIQREIPRHEIANSSSSPNEVSSGNLRQLVLDRMARRGERCRCIRCREIGRSESCNTFSPERLELKRLDYEASDGQEVFLSFEDSSKDSLCAFLRLRIPSGREHRPELSQQCASIVRELHVYGPVVPIGTKASGEQQHRGLGTNLLLEAERISRHEFQRRKQIVISATGTREYYRRRGYKDDGVYVSKPL